MLVYLTISDVIPIFVFQVFHSASIPRKSTKINEPLKHETLN